jgi:glycosyltransferase involved in cell wall biosynthesis
LKVSIITIVYNGEQLLEGTIQSILTQTYTNIEYIVIDGASKDETLSIIQKYTTQISKWISEPDKGLYDAMNKGLDFVTGDFVLFMNCGDRFYAPDTLQKVMDCADATTDILYGETMLVDDDRKELGIRSAITPQKLPHNLRWQSMRYGMVVCHQSILVRNRGAIPRYMENNLSADIDWVINCLKSAQVITNTHTTIAAYLVGGISKQKHNQSLWDRYAVLEKHFGKLPNWVAHLYITIRAIIHKYFVTGTKY